MSYDAMKKALNALDETRQAISGAYSAGYQAGKDNSDIAIDELEQENRLLRARNDRLEKEISKLQENGCKFPLCQNEEHQQGLAEQIKRELYTGQPAQQQEPVAGLLVGQDSYGRYVSITEKAHADTLPLGEYKLYTSPQAQRKPLTDEEIIKCWGQVSGTRYGYVAFARAIEAAHGIKENT